MIVFRFMWRGAKVTWFLSDNWAILFGFGITVSLGLTYRFLKNRFYIPQKKQLPNPQGGNFIDQCIDPESVYEVVDSSVEVMIRKMLSIPNEVGPLVISTEVLILAYILAKKPLHQITLFGLKIFLENPLNVILKLGTGTVTGGAALWFV